MRSLLVVLMAAFLFMTGCNSMTRVDPWMQDKSADLPIASLEATITTHGFRVLLKFEENTEFEGLVQELHLENGWTLVEYFKMPTGQFDLNAYDCQGGGGDSTVVRESFVYPANVEGVDYIYDVFAQLPQNEDGSMVTDIPKNFNMMYQLMHKTQGRIVKSDKSRGFRWRMEWCPKPLSWKFDGPLEP